MKINEDQKLKEITLWFTQYVRPFKKGVEADLRNIILKEDHTFRVCDEILHIGEKLGLNDSQLQLAKIIALLHDIGRFEQYAKYKTFVDQKSEDHAQLGVKILKRYDVLKRFDDSTKKLIFRAIECHSQSSLPQEEKEPSLFFIKLLRDADKLDIWRIVTDYYHLKGGTRNRALELDLPDSPVVSKEVYSDLMNERIVDIDHVKNLNDFKLLQLGWIFDINFNPTFRCIKDRHYLEMIRDVLTETDEIREIFDVVRRHVSRKSE